MARYQVRVTAVPRDKNSAVRALRQLGKLSLPKALELYEFVSAAGEVVVAAGLDRPVAEHLRRALEGGGIGAEIGESPIESPMVLDPGVNEIYEWGPLRTLRRKSSG